jgi:hypothetical protein
VKSGFLMIVPISGASNETIYTSIDGDSVHTPLNGGATGGPGGLPSTTADAEIRTAPPVPERGYLKHDMRPLHK